MARTAEGGALTSRHHRQQLAIRATAARELQRVWSGVDPLDLRGTISRFATAGAAIVTARGRQSAETGGRYFEAFRLAEGLSGRLLPELADTQAVNVLAGALRGAGLAGIINARRRGFSPQAAARNGLVKAVGVGSKLVLDGGRDTIINGIAEDSRALGWRRATGANPCAFCAMLSSRGAVFSASTADFLAHDHDVCEPEPFYEGSQPSATAERFRELWDETRDLNAFRRALGNN